MEYSVSFVGLSDQGLVRQNNEDFWTYLEQERLFILADGMGGHKGGEVASKEAAEYLSVFFKKNFEESDKTLTGVMDALFESICEMNRIIYRMSRQFAELRGMGTTLCSVHLHPEGIIYAHVGDSRIYRLRNKKLERLTRDHSLLRELIDLGQLSEQQADGFLYKNILTKAIGTESSIEPSVQIDSIENGDLILLCTDGLTDMLSDQEIQKTLLADDEEKARTLIEKALERGGRDNVTIVLISINGKNESSYLP